MRVLPPQTFMCPYHGEISHFTYRAHWQGAHREVAPRIDRPDKPRASHSDNVQYAAWSCDACDGPVVGPRSLSDGTPIWYQPMSVPDPRFPDVPESIAADAAEATRCQAISAYRATAAMARRAIQAAAFDKGAPDVRLKDQIDWLASNHVITEQMRDVAHAIRVGGNEGAHPDKDGLSDIDEATAAAFLRFLGDFLRYVYVIPADLDRLAQA